VGHASPTPNSRHAAVDSTHSPRARKGGPLNLRRSGASLAIVEFLDDDSHRVRYLRQPFGREPDFGVTSVNYDLSELLARAQEPR
jgi:hypothetical protein